MDIQPAPSPESQGRMLTLCEIPCTMSVCPGTQIECLEGTAWLTTMPMGKSVDVQDNMLVVGQAYSVDRWTTIYISSLRRAPTRIRLLEKSVTADCVQRGWIAELKRLLHRVH